MFVRRKPYINVNRWFNTIINQPNVKAVIGEFNLCEKMTEFDPKKYAEVQGKTSAPKDKKEKKAQPKKEAPKKEKDTAEPAQELDPAEEALAAEPKSKDPFDALPKGYLSYCYFFQGTIYSLVHYSLLCLLLLSLVLSIWMISRGFIPTKMNLNLFLTSGKNSIKKITQFGSANINTPRNSKKFS